MFCPSGDTDLHAPVIYVHPCGHFNDLIVPSGAISVVNALPVRCNGYFSFEIPEDAIVRAQVMLVDCHWALSIDGLAATVAMARRLNPDIKVIVGGITASVWAARILDFCPVDYVVQGDAEDATVALVSAILDGLEPGPVPNVWSRRGPPASLRRISTEAFSETDTVNAPWFPTSARVSRMHTSSFSLARWIIAARGCERTCGVCYGSYAGSVGGGVIIRSPESVVRQIRDAAADGQPSLRIFFGHLPSSYVERVMDLLVDSPAGFSDTVGFYLCSQLTGTVMAKIHAALPGCKVAISSIWPSEQEATGRTSAALRQEEADCGTMISEASSDVGIEYWYCRPATRRRIDAAIPAASGPDAMVARADIWNLMRPDQSKARGDAEIDLQQWIECSELSSSTGKWQIARRLSPPLARMYAVYGDLDIVFDDPVKMECPNSDFASFWNESLKYWKRWNFPALVDVGFRAWPFRRIGEPREQSSKFHVPKETTLLVGGCWRVDGSASSVSIDYGVDHRGPYLEVVLPALDERPDGWVLLPESTRGGRPEQFERHDALALGREVCAAGGVLKVRLLVYRLQVSFDSLPSRV